MLPGPTYIYECPNCKKPFGMDSLLSGNTLGAENYSDGKRIAPMLPEFPELTRCTTCGAIFWIDGLPAIGGFYDWGPTMPDVPEAWRQAKKARFLTVAQYFTALEKGVARNREEEIYIRQKIWQLFNDRVRKPGTDPAKLFRSEKEQEQWAANIHRLLALLDEIDPDHLALAAELNRHLGNFDRCLEILDSIFFLDYDGLKEQFREACRNKNTRVFRLAEPE